MCLSNFKAIRQFEVPISWLRDFTRSYEKTSFRILRRGPESTDDHHKGTVMRKAFPYHNVKMSPCWKVSLTNTTSKTVSMATMFVDKCLVTCIVKIGDICSTSYYLNLGIHSRFLFKLITEIFTVVMWQMLCFHWSELCQCVTANFYVLNHNTSEPIVIPLLNRQVFISINCIYYIHWYAMKSDIWINAFI